MTGCRVPCFSQCHNETGLCDHHWKMVPGDLRRKFWDAWKERATLPSELAAVTKVIDLHIEQVQKENASKGRRQ